jgi:hypothetical protein
MTTTKLYGPYYDQNAYLEDSRILYLLSVVYHPPDADNNAMKEYISEKLIGIYHVKLSKQRCNPSR